MHSPAFLHSRRRQGDILRTVIWTLVAVIVAAFLLGLNGLRQWEELKKRGKQQKVEVATIFTQAIKDREVTNVIDGNFIVTQRHMGDGMYTFWFTNTAGERAGYFVSRDLERRNLWEFQELVPAPGAPKKIFYRERIKVP